LVAAGTATVRGPRQPAVALPPLTPSVKLIRDPPDGPEEAGATKRSENRVVGPPCVGMTVSAPALVVELELAELELIELEGAELEGAEPQPASPMAPAEATSVIQRRISALSAWRLIAGPSLRVLTRYFAQTVDLSTRM
jgi:hypothetical protein